mgnify:CR=1 FL=1
MRHFPLTRDFFPEGRESSRLGDMSVASTNHSKASFISYAAGKVQEKRIDDMADQFKTKPSDKEKEVGSTGSANYIPKTKEESSGTYNLNMTAMIRSLQRTEGLSDCFRRGIADCDQLKCSWRQYCFDKLEKLSPNSI